MYFRCISCNSEMNPVKKKPCTTYSGSMNSIHTDHVSDFPKDEWEDLCPACRNSISNYNAHLYKEDGVDVGDEGVFFEFSSEFDEELLESLDGATMDSNFIRVNKIYEGYIDD